MNGLPVIIGQRRSGLKSELDILVAPDCPWFEGHFPGQPILPGVVQVGWVVHFAGELHGYKHAVHELEQVKFKHPILPGAKLTLRLTADPDRHRLRYEYHDGITSVSSGTLNFDGTA